MFLQLNKWPQAQFKLEDSSGGLCVVSLRPYRVLAGGYAKGWWLIIYQKY